MVHMQDGHIREALGLLFMAICTGMMFASAAFLGLDAWAAHQTSWGSVLVGASALLLFGQALFFTVALYLGVLMMVSELLGASRFDLFMGGIDD